MCLSDAKEVLSQPHAHMLAHPPASRAFHQNEARKTLQRDNIVSHLLDNDTRSIQGTGNDGLGIQTRSLGILSAEPGYACCCRLCRALLLDPANHTAASARPR